MSTPLIHPTDGELAILKVLWERGPSTVREVHTVLSQGREVGYTTVMKLMQIMAQKGLVARDERERSHVYQATQEKAPTQSHLLSGLLQKAFDGKAVDLVSRALAEHPASEEDLDAIQALLERARKERR